MAIIYRTDGRRHDDEEHVAVEVLVEINETPRRVRLARKNPPGAEEQVRGALMEAGFCRFELCAADENTVLVAVPEGAMLRARTAALAELLRDAHYEVEQASDGVLLVSVPGASAIAVAEVAA